MEDFYTMSGSIGKIPEFGSWGCATELPYTHYFHCDTEADSGYHISSCYSPKDLYAVDFADSWQFDGTPGVKVHREHRSRHKVRKVLYVDQLQKKQSLKQPRSKINSSARRETRCRQYAKPVDEDLYKIPPELICASKKKKMVGFFSRLVPTCIK